MVASTLRHRAGRSLAVVLAIVVAAVSFSVLASAVVTSRLQVHGTINANYRSAYDILVRPVGSRSSVERSQGLVRENYLAGIFGGITMAQWHRIERIPGVSVAAPVAMIGYLMPFENVNIPIGNYVTGASHPLFRVTETESGDNGLSHYPAPSQYVYVNNEKHPPAVDGMQSTCSTFYENLPAARSPFDVAAGTSMFCDNTRQAPARFARVHA
jgi:hypothetical protein